MKITNTIFKNFTLASLNQRMENFTIDFIISSSLGVLIAYLSSTSFLNFIIIYYVVRFVYYFIFEYYFDRTLGKYDTQTKIVNIDNSKPSIFQLVKRNLSRFFSLISAVDDEERAIHDIFSQTFVITDKNLKKIEIWNLLEKVINLLNLAFFFFFIYQYNRQQSFDMLKILLPILIITILINVLKKK